MSKSNISKLFTEASGLYASSRPIYPAALFQWLARECLNQQQVWDAGCGNGQASIGLRNYFEKVQATDISSSQIAHSQPAEGVTFSIQPSEATTFADEIFDAVCVAQALHWFDLKRFWPEVHRVLKPGGVFAAWGYVWPRIDSSIDQLLKDQFLSTIEPYWAEQNRLLWDGYIAIKMPFTQLETPQLALNMQWSLDQFFSYLQSWSATRLCMEAIGPTFFEKSLYQVGKMWGEGGKRNIAMDLVIIAGRK